MANHGHEGHQARAPADEQQRSTITNVPGEVATDRTSELEGVASLELVGQVRGDLAVVDALDGQGDGSVTGRRGDGVGPLGLVAVFSREADVDVHAGHVPRPPGHLEHDRPGPGCLVLHVGDSAHPPGQWRPAGS